MSLVIYNSVIKIKIGTKENFVFFQPNTKVSFQILYYRKYLLNYDVMSNFMLSARTVMYNVFVSNESRTFNIYASSINFKYIWQ